MATVPVTKQELIDAATDAETLEQVANGDSVTTVTSRLGQQIKTVSKAISEISTYVNKGAWATTTSYAIKDLVQSGGITYVCTNAHTSGTFSTDLAAGKWGVFQTKLPYERLSNYASLSAAVTAIGANVVDLLLDTNATLSANLTIPVNISLRPVQGYTIGGAFTLTHNGAIRDSVQKLFESALTVNLTYEVPTIRPEWWGAVGDGTTNCKPAFEAMRKCAEGYSQRGRTITIEFVNGVYATEGSLSTYLIHNVVMNFHGAQLKNTYAGVFFLDRIAYTSGGPLYNEITTNNDSLINTVNAGSNTVTCKTVADAANFVVGRTAVVTCHDQQGAGYPPNHAMWDFVTITNANATTGVITFKEALKNSYRDDAVDLTPASQVKTGAARIWYDDNGANRQFTYYGYWMGESLTINDLVVISGGVHTVQACSFQNYREITVNNYRCGNPADTPFLSGYAGESDIVTFNNSVFSAIEIDKHLNNMIMNECHYNQLSEGTGCNNVVSNNCIVRDRGATGLAAKNLRYQNSTVMGYAGTAIVLNKNAWPCNSIMIDNCEVYGLTSTKSIAAVRPDPGFIFTGGDIVIDEANRLVKVLKTATNANQYMHMASPDTYLKFAPSHSIARILYTYADGTHYISKVEFIGDTSADTSLTIGLTAKVRLAGNRYINCFPKSGIHNALQFEEDNNPSGRRLARYNTGYIKTAQGLVDEMSWQVFINQPEVYGFRVNVERAYTGSDTTARLEMGPLGSTQINLKTAGLREVTYLNSYGSQTGDSLPATTTFPTNVADFYAIVTAGGAVTDTVLAGTDDQQAIFTIEILFQPRSIETQSI